MRLRAWSTLGVLVLIVAACGDSDGGGSATVVAPDDGARVAGALTVSMGAEGVTIEPAGEVRDGAGHFHVLVDVGCVGHGDTIPGGVGYNHFGKAQTETVLYLGPGEHTLCLQVGDGEHTALDVTDEITVNVAVTDIGEWCATISELDAISVESPEFDDDPDGARSAWAKVGALADQLLAADEGLVDAGFRDVVSAEIAVMSELGSSLAASSSPEEAEEVIATVLEDSATEENFGAVEDYVQDTCGFSIG
jgi:hypothetical protein